MQCFTEWLHRWQELVAAFVGAAALSFTVWWTLSAEQRKRAEQSSAMKVALGAEIRQYAARALFGCQRISSHEQNARKVHTTAVYRCGLLEDLARFPDPIVYPNSAAALGTLGDGAYLTVQFFNQISIIRAKVLAMTAATPQHVVIAREQVLNWEGRLLTPRIRRSERC
jgi:hypothetical protein